MATPICLRLLLHDMRAAASRTFWTAGSSRPIRIAMMAITTSSSISVNARRIWLRNGFMVNLSESQWTGAKRWRRLRPEAGSLQFKRGQFVGLRFDRGRQERLVGVEVSFHQ